MKISARIFLGYFFIVGVGVYLLLNTFVAELRPGVRQSMEEVMVDTANLLAEVVQQEVGNGKIRNGNFASNMQRFLNREFDALIWSKLKKETDLRIYITDQNGIVVYDSTGKDVGSDYSRWRDVYLTLRGQYGARSTLSDPDDSNTSVMHVAAPIVHNGNIIGVLTVAKPNISVQPFIEISRRKITFYSVIVVIVSVLTGFLFALWFTDSIRKLVKYANKVSRGEKVKLPVMTDSDLSQLATAVETMRQELEGKDYVESYIHTLTHEMKSPLSAIKGAAELLQEDMPAPERERFLNNILNEAKRLQDFVKRMLDLASVEKRQSLQELESVNVWQLWHEISEERIAELKQKELSVRADIPNTMSVEVERFLFKQSLANLLDNAIAFSPVKGQISIEAEIQDERCCVRLYDAGPGVPEYAMDHVYERFYSLPRPDTGKKSSGIGLSFVREVMALHKGKVELKNRDDGGLEATLTVPSAQNT